MGSPGVATTTPAIPLGGAAFVVARFYSYDPYYAPTLRRMSDGGSLPGWWIIAVVALAVGGALATTCLPRLALAAAGAAALLCAATAFLAGLGH
jgi:hypothetical protein